MKKAVVLSRDGKTALVMEQGGAFRRVPARKHWQKGDVVTLAPAEGGHNSKAFAALRRWAVLAAGIFLIMAVVGYTYYYYTGKPISVISIDINPSIQLELNMQARVISTTGYNADGEAALEGLDLSGMSVQEALQAMLESEGLKPYLEGDATIAFGVSIANLPENVAQQMLGEIEQQIGDVVNDAPNPDDKISFILSEFTWDLLSKAQELDVSAGKLALAMQAMEHDPSLTLEQLLEYSVEELQLLLEE